jgi:hypothetical protein
VQHAGVLHLVEQRVDVGHLDPAAGGAGEERLGAGAHRTAGTGAGPPRHVAGLPEVQDGVVPAQDGEAAVLVQDLEAQLLGVEGDSRHDVADRKRGNGAAEGHAATVVSGP